MRATSERLWSRDQADGERLLHEGRYDEAETKFHAAVLHARDAGIDDARVASSYYQLAVLVGRRGRRSEALDLYKRALEAEERALGPDHPYVAMVLRGYAAQLRQAGHAGQAAALDARAEAIWRGEASRGISGKITEARVA